VAHAAAGHGVVPGFFHVGGAGDLALAFARGAHHRFDDAGVAGGRIDRGLQFLQRITEHIRAGGQAQGFGGQAAYAFAVHRQARGTRRGDHTHRAGGLELFEHGRGNRFDLGHDQVGFFFFNQCLELGRVAHGDGARMMGYLLARRVLITVGGNRFHTQALQRDQHLLAQLAGAEQHDFGGVGGQGGSESCHR